MDYVWHDAAINPKKHTDGWILKKDTYFSRTQQSSGPKNVPCPLYLSSPPFPISWKQLKYLNILCTHPHGNRQKFHGENICIIKLKNDHMLFFCCCFCRLDKWEDLCRATIFFSHFESQKGISLTLFPSNVVRHMCDGTFH